MARIDFTESATNPKNIVLFRNLQTSHDRFRYLCRSMTFHDVRRLKMLVYASFLRTLYWEVVRDEVVTVAEGKCSLCGSTKDINVHHRNYIFQGEEFKNLDCLQILCRGCHSLGHHLKNAKTQEQKIEALIIGLADDKRVSPWTMGKINRSYNPRVLIDFGIWGDIRGYQGGEDAGHQDS